MGHPDFEYDLFISYAHIDNQHYSDVPKGWIDYLHDRLEISLSKRLGRTPKIWRDRKLRGNEVFNDEINADFRRSNQHLFQGTWNRSSQQHAKCYLRTCSKSFQ